MATADLTPEQVALLPEADRLAIELEMAEQFGLDSEGDDNDDTSAGNEDRTGADDTTTTTTTTTKPAGDDTTKPADQPAGADEDLSDKPAYTATVPDDLAAQIQAQKDAKTAARKEDRDAFKKLNDGEIDFDDYEKIKNKSDQAIEDASDAIAALNQAQTRAQVSAEMTQQAKEKAWGDIIKAHNTAAKDEGLDYLGNEALNKEVNGLLKAFSIEAQERGMSDDGLKASKWVLKQAHDTMKLRHPELVVAPKPVAGKPREEGAPRHNLTNLSRMPNADRALIDDDDVSRFNAVPGHKTAEAIAGMSKADAEKLFAKL